MNALRRISGNGKRKMRPYFCRECDLDFYIMVAVLKRKFIHCPFCGDYVSVEEKDVYPLTMPGKKAHWTPAEVALLIELYTGAHRHSYEQIAEIVNHSKRAVHGKLCRLRTEGIIE